MGDPPIVVSMIVARQTGFSDRDHMRRAFGQPPQVLRRIARQEASDYED